MKASILLATYNKNECLPNTLYSISQQKTTFPVEVCVVDDCSDVDPEPIIKKFVPDAKYKRLEKHVGLPYFQSICCELMSEDSDIVIIQSSDVMYLGNSVIQNLCDAVKPGFFSMATVKNISVGDKLYQHDILYGDTTKTFIKNWDQVQGIHIYSGKDRPGGDWLLFLGAMTKDDMIKIDFDYRCCDVIVQQKIKEKGLQPIFLDEVKAVHQKHPPADLWPCSIVDSCEYWCRRKGGLLK